MKYVTSLSAVRKRHLNLIPDSLPVESAWSNSELGQEWIISHEYWIHSQTYSIVMWQHCSLPLQGWGLLSQFSPFRYFPYFPLLSKQTLAIEYHVYIWQVLPQLSCGDTCQIWMWFRESNRYFRNIENFAYGEISERSFSNPHPWQDCLNTTQIHRPK